MSSNELRGIIQQKNGHLNGAFIDRSAFANLIRLHNQGVSFSLRRASFIGIDLSSRLIHDPNAREILAFFRVSNLDLSHSVFVDANLNDVLFENCNLRGATFRRANCSNTTFYGCDLFRTMFSEATSLKPAQVFKSFNRTEAIYTDPTEYQKMLAGFVALHQESARSKRPKKFGIKSFYLRAYRKIMNKLAGEPHPRGPKIFVDITQTGNTGESKKTRQDIFERSCNQLPQEITPTISAPPTLPMPRADLLREATKVVHRAQQSFASNGHRKFRQKELSKIHKELKEKPNVHSGNEVGN
ncbi:MAG: pentapeptide repeat-containing protein [Rickettsiales bacterium]